MALGTPGGIPHLVPMAIAVPQPGPQLVPPGLKKVHRDGVGSIAVVKDTCRHPEGSGRKVRYKTSERRSQVNHKAGRDPLELVRVFS